MKAADHSGYVDDSTGTAPARIVPELAVTGLTTEVAEPSTTRSTTAAVPSARRSFEPIAAKRAAFENGKAKGMPKEQLLVIKGEWEAAKKDKEAAKAEHTTTVERLGGEVEQVHQLHAAELRQAIKGYAAAQLAHAKRAQQVWAALAGYDTGEEQ